MNCYFYVSWLIVLTLMSLLGVSIFLELNNLKP